jgi:lysophospholipase L1-like esterase
VTSHSNSSAYIPDPGGVPWPDIIRNLLLTDLSHTTPTPFPVQVYNYSWNGATAQSIVNQNWSALPYWFAPGRNTCNITWLGFNDVALFNRTGQQLFQDVMAHTSNLRNAGVEQQIIVIPPAYSEAGPDLGWYGNSMVSACEVFSDMFAFDIRFIENDPNYYNFNTDPQDLVHLSAEGHERIAGDLLEMMGYITG